MTDSQGIKAGEDGCVHLSGDLTFKTVPVLFARAKQLFDGDIIRIDLSAVKSADSAGLSLLLEWQAAQKTATPRIRFTHAPASLLSLAGLCEASNLLDISGRSSGDG